MTSPLNDDNMCIKKGGKTLVKPKENTKRINVFLPSELLQELKEEAKQKGLNVSSLIRMILLDRKNK